MWKDKESCGEKWRGVKGYRGGVKDAEEACGKMAGTESHTPVVMLPIEAEPSTQRPDFAHMSGIGHLSDEGAPRCFLQPFWCVCGLWGRGRVKSSGEIGCLIWLSTPELGRIRKSCSMNRPGSGHGRGWTEGPEWSASASQMPLPTQQGTGWFCWVLAW